MSDDTTQLRLKRINAKGWEVNEKLTALLAGKDLDLSSIGISGVDMIDDKEQRLRGFLDMINAARKRLNAGPYGACLACGEPFAPAALDEQPWLEVCSNCAASAAPYERWPGGR